MEEITAAKKGSQNIKFAPWWLAAVWITNLPPFMMLSVIVGSIFPYCGFMIFSLP